MPLLHTIELPGISSLPIAGYQGKSEENPHAPEANARENIERSILEYLATRSPFLLFKLLSRQTICYSKMALESGSEVTRGSELETRLFQERPLRRQPSSAWQASPPLAAAAPARRDGAWYHPRAETPRDAAAAPRAPRARPPRRERGARITAARGTTGTRSASSSSILLRPPTSR